MFLWIRASATETEITRKMVSVGYWRNTDETRRMVENLYDYAYKDRLRQRHEVVRVEENQ